jgi:phage regulator Rha-like protein
MTKDGFMFLVMGFTGKKAAQVREAFINAFNAMQDFIRSQRGLMQMLAENAAIEKESKQRASSGSKLMLVRKREKPVILQQRLTLERQLQPSLFLA